jgi:small conductance mechanosensitive channel
MKTSPIWDRLNVNQLVTQFVAWLPSLFSAFLILGSFWLIHRITRPAVLLVFTRANLDPALARMLEKVYKFTLMLFGTLMAVNQLGINVGAALAGLGVVGLTIGFAAKDTLSNIISGFLIFWDKPFHAGDWVTVGDQYGKVVEITMRSTRLLTWNNTFVIIPNQTAISQVMINHSAMGNLRIEVPISGVPVNGDFSEKQQDLLQAVRNTPGVLRDPPPAVVVKAITGTTLDLIIFAWIRAAEDERPIFSRILEASKPVLSGAAQPA